MISPAPDSGVAYPLGETARVHYISAGTGMIAGVILVGLIFTGRMNANTAYSLILEHTLRGIAATILYCFHVPSNQEQRIHAAYSLLSSLTNHNSNHYDDRFTSKHTPLTWTTNKSPR